MNQKNLSLRPIKCAFVFTLVALGFASFPIGISAQPNESINRSVGRLRISFNQRDEDGASKGRPGHREGTATRGSDTSCFFRTNGVIALVPHIKDNNDEVPVALTVEENPTFWLHVLYTSEEIPSGEFVLQDEENNDVYRTFLKLPVKPGIVSLSLPKEVALAIDKPYQWYFKLSCGSPELNERVFVRGWVQRLAPKLELESQLKAATPRDRVVLYAANGIWHSALTDLAKLRQAFPNDAVIEEDWADLLREVDLEHLFREPFVGSVTASFLPERKDSNNTDFRP